MASETQSNIEAKIDRYKKTIKGGAITGSVLERVKKKLADALKELEVTQKLNLSEQKAILKSVLRLNKENEISFEDLVGRIEIYLEAAIKEEVNGVIKRERSTRKEALNSLIEIAIESLNYYGDFAPTTQQELTNEIARSENFEWMKNHFWNRLIKISNIKESDDIISYELLLELSDEPLLTSFYQHNFNGIISELRKAHW